MKLFKWFPLRKNSLGRRIFILVITLTLSIVIVLAAVFGYISSNIIRNHLETVVAAMVDTNAAEIDKVLDDALKNALRIANDPKFQAILRNPRPQNLSQAYSLELELDNQLSFIQNYVDHLFGFYVIGANGLQFKSNFSSAFYQDWPSLEWYKQIIESKDPVWFNPHNGSFTVHTIGQPLITMGLRIVDKSSGNILGVILTDIEVTTLENIIKRGIGDSGHIVLTASDGTTITGSYPNASAIISEYHYTKPLDLAGWQLTGYLHPSAIESSLLSVITPLFLFIIFITIVVLIAAGSMAYRITSPLRELSNLMEVVQTGNFQVSMQATNDDEIGHLSNSFNIMVAKINELMLDLHDEQEKLRIAEMKTLEAQINPHFLYNTLDSIIWLARKGKMEDVSRLVFSLSKLLRIGLNHGRTMVTIEEEIEHIRNYLLIQQVRYEDDFDYEIAVPETILHNKTPKLILQPLVENAIIHGIQLSDKKEKLYIKAFATPLDIIFHVTNTGIPIDPEKVKQINDSLPAPDPTGNGGIGLRNVHDRIRIYFGTKYGLQFVSNSEGETTVIVHLPRI